MKVKYRNYVETFEAVYYTGSEASRRELSELAGHWVSMGYHVTITTQGGHEYVLHGMWVVKHGPADFRLYTPAEFGELYVRL